MASRTKEYLNFISYHSTPNKHIYHYTDIHGFEGIIKNNCLWATKIDFLNDFKELKDGLGLLDNEINKRIDLYKTQRPKFKLASFYLNYLQIVMDNYPVISDSIYVISFSSNEDNLLLWNYYSNSNGYSIKFNYEDIYQAHKKDDKDIIVAKVIYDDKIKRKFINYEIDHYLKVIEEKLSSVSAIELKRILKLDISEMNNEQVYLDILKAVLPILQFIIGIMVSMKDPSFVQEEEVRIILFNEEPEYRIANNCFIPYSPFKYNLKSIDGFGIGPKNNLSLGVKGLNLFLKKCNFKNPNIFKSSCPYRF